MKPIIDNIGIGVAENVELHLEFRIPPIPLHPEIDASSPHPNMFELAWGGKNWCEALNPAARAPATYFPKEVREEHNWDLNILTSDMQKSGLISRGEPRFTVLFYGCVLYQFKEALIKPSFLSSER
jgi:hypothetical protein